MKGIILALAMSLGSLLAQESPSVNTVTRDMVGAAQAFLASLSPEQQKLATFVFREDQRENWGFIPRERKGLPLEALDSDQISLLRSLLKSALSDPGLHKVDTIILLEGLLGELEKRPDFRNPKAYFTSIFGKPSSDGTWAWRFEGHHISLNYTLVAGNTISVTPSFFAASPSHVIMEHPLKGSRPLHAEEDLARALAIALKQTDKPVIFSEKPPKEIFTAENRSIKQLAPVGVLTSEMTEDQTRLLMELITVYAQRHRKELAEKDLLAISKDLANLRFGWAGSLAHGKPYYYRIQGTSLLIEVANVQNHANHIHTVWRDVKHDFARDVLGDHIQHEH